MKGSSSTDDIKGTKGKTSKSEARPYSGNREAISQKYAVMREQNKQTSSSKPIDNTIASAKVSLLNTGTSDSANDLGRTSSGMSTWQSMKMGLQNFKTNLGSKKFLPTLDSQETKLLSHDSSSESLDEIFQRLKRPSSDSTTYVDADEDDDDTDVKNLGPKR